MRVLLGLWIGEPMRNIFQQEIIGLWADGLELFAQLDEMFLGEVTLHEQTPGSPALRSVGAGRGPDLPTTRPHKMHSRVSLDIRGREAKHDGAGMASALRQRQPEPAPIEDGERYHDHGQ